MTALTQDTVALDAVDRLLVNDLQEGIPVCERPFAQAASRAGIDEKEVVTRIERLLEGGVLTRFGPLYNAERLGGALTLAALSAREEDFETIAETVNGFTEVAHNYRRDHDLNMWFVLAVETPERIAEVLNEIETATGCKVLDFPKIDEYYIGLKFHA